MHLKWFDSLVEPIILYGSEVWGFENIQIMERIHLKFCKRISNVRLTTPNYMVYGELVRYLLKIRVKLRMVSFWTKHVQSENKLSNNLYRLLLQIHQSGNHDFKRISFVMSIFDNTGLSYICVNQLNINIHSLKTCSKRTLTWSRYSTVVYRCWTLISWWILLDLQIWIWIWKILIKIISQK